MKTSLLKGLSEDDKTEVRKQFAGSYRLREQITKILTEQRDAHIQKMVSGTFDAVNWNIEQAATIASVKEINRLIALIEN